MDTHIKVEKYTYDEIAKCSESVAWKIMDGHNFGEYVRSLCTI